MEHGERGREKDVREETERREERREREGVVLGIITIKGSSWSGKGS